MNKVFKYLPITDLLEKIIDNRGKTVPTSEKGIPLIATNCIKHSSIYPTFEKVRYVNEETHTNWFRAHLRPNDILFVNKGTPGRVCLVPDPVNFCAAQDMMAFRCNKDLIDYKYLFAVLRSEEIQKKIANNHVGLVIPHLRKQDLPSILIPIRNRKEQEYIGNFYISISEKIELNNQINTELEAIAKTLYDYWFVQFDFPDANGKPYKTSGGKMVWNQELKREIPEGWKVDSLSSWINNDKSGDWGKEQEEGNYNQKVYCIRGADINGLNGKGEMKTPERYILEKNLHKTLDPYDLIVEISGGSPVQSTGRLAYITEETLHRFNAPIICSNFCKAVTLKNKNYFYNFVYQWNSVYDAGVLFGYEGKTSGIKNLLFDSFVSTYQTPIPPVDLAEKFYEFMTPIQSKKEKNLKQNQQLASLRDWLLPMLMNGQVSVGDVEEELGIVAEPDVIYQKEEKKVAEKTKKVKVVTIKLNPIDVYKRTLLAAEIVFQLKNEYTLGHLKLQKLLFLCQEMENMNLPMNFLKQAMGPYDNQLARSLDKQFIEKKWFVYQKEESLKYKPLENCGKHSEDFKKYFENQIQGITHLINMFRKFTSPNIEAVATLYACWKEAIENKELVNDKLIIIKFYNWSEEKAKFIESDLYKHLEWMRNNGIVPKEQMD